MNFLQMLAIAPLLQSNPEPTMSKAQAKLMLEHLAEERVNRALDLRKDIIIKEAIPRGVHPNEAWRKYLEEMEDMHLNHYNFMGITKEKGIELWEFFKEEVCQVLKEHDEGYLGGCIEKLRTNDTPTTGSLNIPSAVVADKLESGEMAIMYFPTFNQRAFKWVDESRPEAQDPEYLAYIKRSLEKDRDYYYEIVKIAEE